MIKSIGFCGQGWVGKNYADWYEENSDYEVVRYSLEPEYIGNKEKIKDCQLVYVCVPTPTTPEGFDYSILEDVLGLVGDGNIALLKSTLLPGTTRKLQEKFPNISILFSPEFLTEATAFYDVANPSRNIIGYVNDNGFKRAGEVMVILPIAPYENIVKVEEAELIKYGGNCWFYFKVIFMNMFYDWVKTYDVDFETIKNGMAADKRIGRTHLDPIHKKGRGAGGDCFIKDFEAFKLSYFDRVFKDEVGAGMLELMSTRNIELLMSTNKDVGLLEGVYGREFTQTVLSNLELRNKE